PKRTHAPGFRNLPPSLDPGLLQCLGHECTRGKFLEGGLRIRMDLAPKADHFLEILIGELVNARNYLVGHAAKITSAYNERTRSIRSINCQCDNSCSRVLQSLRPELVEGSRRIKKYLSYCVT